MKVLKSILSIYLGILSAVGIGIFILFPIWLVETYKDERFFFLFIINMPIFFGFLLTYIDSSCINTRPKR